MRNVMLAGMVPDGHLFVRGTAANTNKIIGAGGHQ